MPNSLKEWVQLELDEDFIERVIKGEDYNFMSKLIFDKAEMTFTYGELLCDILENAGLLNYMVMLLIFMKFIATYIINDINLL